MKLISFLLKCMVLLPGTLPAQSIPEVRSILVKFNSRNDLTQWVNHTSRTRTGISDMNLVSSRKNILRINYENAGLASEAFHQFRGSSDVETAVFNHRLKSRNNPVTPNDPLFSQQWNLDKVGLRNLWDRTTGGLTPCGDTIVIAVFDDGYDRNHEDMKNLLWANKSEIPGNGKDDDQNGYIDDYWGLNLDTGNDQHAIDPDYHGNAVSSVIVSNSNNGIGIAGTNWNVKLLMISSLEKDQALAIEAYEYLLDLRKRYNESNGADGAYVVAVNNSWGQEGLFEEDFQLMCDMYNDLGGEGILNVGSTENDQVNTDVFGDIPSDCSSDFLIVVTNTDQNDRLAVAGWGKKNVDLGAPGEQIQVVGPGNTYKKDSGTSFSAPLVTGAIGLIYSLDEATFCDDARLSPPDAILALKRYILEGVKPIADLKDRSVSGGRLDLGKTVDMVTSTVDQGILDVSMFPNPTKGLLYLSTVQPVNGQWQMTDSWGRILTTGILQANNQLKLDISSYPSGYYFFKLISKELTIVRKIARI